MLSCTNNNIEFFVAADKKVLRPLNQNQLPSLCRERNSKPFINNVSPLVPKATLQYPIIKCTSHFKRSYIDLDDERASVITDVEGTWYVRIVILVQIDDLSWFQHFQMKKRVVVRAISACFLCRFMEQTMLRWEWLAIPKRKNWWAFHFHRNRSPLTFFW